MAIKRRERLLNFTPSATGEGVSNWVSADNYKDLIFVLKAGSATYAGSGSDTFDCWIETSDTDDSTQHASRIKALDLVDPLDNSVVQAFDQIVGGLTLPTDTKTATTLRQQLDLKSPNVEGFIRAKYSIAGTPANLGLITLDMYANKEE